MNAGGLYVVWGYIAGKVMPPNVTIGDLEGDNWFRITYEPPESFSRLDPPGVVSAGATGGTWATGTERRIRVFSRAAFQVPVRVDDPDEAMRTAEQEVLPRHLAATSAVTGCPLYAVPLAFHAAGEPEAWRPRRADASVLIFNPKLLDAETVDAEQAAGFAWAAEHDYTARRAAVDMYVGNHRMLSHADNSSDVQAVLLSYFFVLERIANRIARFFPLRPGPEESAPLIESLEIALEDARSIEGKVEAVRVAAQRLQAIHSRGMRRRVKEAGTTMGLPDEVSGTAGELTDLRNTSLGHVSTADQAPDALIAWLPKAQECAHAYLSGYLSWVHDRGFAAYD